MMARAEVTWPAVPPPVTATLLRQDCAGTLDRCGCLSRTSTPGYHNSFPYMAARQHRYRATVLVLGDLGRSPRMLNHALALAADGAEVSLCGYQETPVDGAVLRDPRIRLYRIRTLRRASERAPRFWFLF